jgi:hypothetical protein
MASPATRTSFYGQLKAAPWSIAVVTALGSGVEFYVVTFCRKRGAAPNGPSKTLARLCPVLCPPPNPTGSDQWSDNHWKALLEKTFVAICSKW